jgi:ABC-type transporter MlaC component
MEYVQTTPSNINKYIDDFHTCVKNEFASSLTKIYNEEIGVYRDLIENVVKLPFIQDIIIENRMLKDKLMSIEQRYD